MISFCRILEAPFLHLLTPERYVFNKLALEQARDFFSSVNLKGIQLAWEVRGPRTPALEALMQDFDIVNSVDLSKEESVGESDVVYTRLFGKGRSNIYQFTDDELVEIDQRIIKAQVKTAIVAYHGTRMNSDALRFKGFKELGKFLPVTDFTGLESAKSVLLEDAKFPLTRTQLIENQGWKVFDVAADRRIHLSDLLSKLPERIYYTVNEVIRDLTIYTGLT
jgi:hypothetical protein